MNLSRSAASLYSLLCCILVTFGCSGQGRSDAVESRRTAQVAYDEAIEALGKGEYAFAEQRFTVALSHELQPDLVSSAIFGQAESAAALGRVSEALILVEDASEGLESEVDLYIARGKVYVAAGDKPKARAEFETARKLARKLRINVRIPRDP